MSQEHEAFTYTYSAQQRTEVEQIRKKYLPPQEDKMAQLRRLDQSVTQKARSVAITLGVIGALILGTGMSLCMSELGVLLGEYAMAVGILVGLTGLLLVALALPVYHRTVEKERKRIAPEILR